MAHISIQNLSFTYPQALAPALDGVSLEVEQGAFVLLFGKTGCGKTTLLRHLKTALAPHGQRTGGVFVDGVALDDVSPREQTAGIGFVMQDPDAQIVTDKVWHELAFGLENIGLAQDEMRLRVAEVASYFGIQEWLDRPVAELSGGQKQLLVLASALALRPSVLVLDEPTSQLDPISAADFLGTVRKVNEEFGTTIIVSEHRLEELYPHATWVVAMDEGRVCVQGNPRAVAAQLLAEQHDLACALPVAARVCWQVDEGIVGAGRDGEGGAGDERGVGTEREASAETLPLSTAEGRSWLRARVLESRGSAPNANIDATASTNIPFAVEAHEVWFRYGRTLPDVLKGASFQIPQGTTFAFIGGNGVGKSTVLRLACGACTPHHGRVTLLGTKLSAWSKDALYSGAVALLPQDPTSLFAKKTVREELEEMLTPNTPPDQGKAALEEAARLCGVAELADMHPLDLSGGQAQRLALAKILVRKPRVLLLDEPTKGIDAVYKRDLAALFAQLKADGHTIVLASHDIEFCARYADEVALLFDGQVATCGAPHRVFGAASYYTTAASRMSRGVLDGAVVEEDLVGACQN